MLQVDDDSYVKVDRLLKKLEAASRTTMFMGAIEDPGGGPNRQVGHQWYVSEEDWPSEAYPPWAHGVGYIVTQDIVREIAAGTPCTLCCGEKSVLNMLVERRDFSTLPPPPPPPPRPSHIYSRTSPLLLQQSTFQACVSMSWLLSACWEG